MLRTELGFFWEVSRAFIANRVINYQSQEVSLSQQGSDFSTGLNFWSLTLSALFYTYLYTAQFSEYYSGYN